jgi:O-antigen/teichoic acid export membrane protein
VDDHNLTGKATLNAGAALLAYAVRAMLGLLVVPVLLGAMGRSLFGTWEMLVRLATYLSAADGRPAEALRLVVANRIGTGGPADVRRSIGSSIYVWLLFLPLSCAAGAVMIWLAPSVLRTPAELNLIIRVTTALLVLNFLVTTVMAIPQAVLQGANLGYVQAGWLAAVHAVAAALMVAAIYSGLGMAGVAGAQVVASVIGLAVFVTLVRRLLPQFGVSRPRSGELRPFLRLSSWTLAGDVIAQLALASDVLILGALVGSAAVASYVITGYAATALVAVLSTLLLAAAPGLGAVIGHGDYRRARAIRDELVVLGWIVATAAGTTTVMWNRSFVTLWVGAEHHAGAQADLLIVVLMLQTVLIRADAYVIDATLDVRGRVLVGAAAAGAAIALAALLTPVYQITGLCIGFAAGRVLQSVGQPILVRRLLGAAPGARWPGAARRLAVSAVLLFAAARAGRAIDPGSWFEWAVGAALCTVLALALAWVAGLGTEGRRLLKRRIAVLRSSAAGLQPLPGLP